MLPQKSIKSQKNHKEIKEKGKNVKDFTLGKGLGNMKPSNFSAGINTQRFGQVIYVSPDLVVPNPKNKYEVTNIDELADNIAVYGLLQPLLVKGPFPDKTYMLLGGERRWTAIKKVMVENPKAAKKLEKIPVEVYGPSDLDEIDEEIIIRETNSQARNMEKYRKQDVWELYDLYKKKQERGDTMPENIIKRISEKMGIGQRQVQKIVSIDEYMIPEMKEKVEDGSISINKASKIAHLSKEKQEELYKILEDTGTIDMSTIQEIEAKKMSVPETDDSFEAFEKALFPEKYQDENIPSQTDSEELDDWDQEEPLTEAQKQEQAFLEQILTWIYKVGNLPEMEFYQRSALEQMQRMIQSILKR